MRAVVVHEFADIDGIGVEQVPDPIPGRGEVLVQVEAVAANLVDLLVIAGKYQFLPERPFTPGKLPVGTVISVGDSVGELKPGDRVQSLVEHGGYAELVTAPAEHCIVLPDALSCVDAAAMALVYDTAWFALRDRARLEAGETVLVLGATGGVGHAAVQLAKFMGARVLGSASSPDRADIARAAGADAIVDLSVENLRDNLREQIYAANDGAGADVIIDCIGGDVFDAAIRGLAWRGRLVVVGFASGRIPTLKVNYLLLKNIEVSGLQVSDYRKRDLGRMRACFSEIHALYQAGKLQPMAPRTLPLDRFDEALRSIRDRQARGRMVLVPTTPPGGN